MKRGIYIKILEFGYDKNNHGEPVTFNYVIEKLGKSKYNEKILSIFCYENFYQPQADIAIKSQEIQSGKDELELIDLKKYYDKPAHMKSE